MSQVISYNRRSQLKTRIAAIISFLCSPFILLPLTYILVLMGVVVQGQQMLATIIVFGVGFIPLMLFLVLLKMTRLISDWEIHKRKERYIFYFFALFCGGIMIFLLNRFAIYSLLPYFFLVFILIGLMALINFFWKISGHTASVTFLVMTALQLYGTVVMPSLMLIPLVAWARVYRKDHTLGQAIGGILLSLLIYSFGYGLHLI